MDGAPMPMGASGDAGLGDALALEAHDAAGRDHTMPREDSGSDGATAALGPECDEDNPVTTEALGVDRALPAAIVQFERHGMWGCMHREWHDTRQWDIFSQPGSTSPRLNYALAKGWQRNAVQEGAPGNGLEFLAMHRAMVAILRSTFPAQASLFAGWTAPPLVATANDPLPATASGKATFNLNMQSALNRLNTQLASFTTDDAFGLYIQSQLRWTAADVTARSPDATAGIHAYFHVRFDDPQSAIRMQRFNRNIESQLFWRVHGYLDGLWTKNRVARGVIDANDAPYLAAMTHACLHMGKKTWSPASASCLP